MKWDLITVSSLYLVAIAREQNQGELGHRRVRSMRDLRKSDLTWLKKIRSEAGKIVKERWDLAEGGVRFFVHYQPSYCDFPMSLPVPSPC
jgi:m7GpppX diphosphatase